jgi:AmmeMemoRadiSam system protein A
MAGELSTDEKKILLKLARAGLEATVTGQAARAVDPGGLTPNLLRPGCCFVTLTIQGELRGCIGGLQAEQPLWQEVRQRAGHAAQRDYRFLPVTRDELPEIEIEVSVLTPPEPLAYDTPASLPGRLRPLVDGVVLRQGPQRATFLPQVWEHVPDPEQFLSLLCQKLGARPDAWRHTHLDVEIYQVEKFTESEFKAEAGVEPAISGPPN